MRKIGWLPIFWLLIGSFLALPVEASGHRKKTITLVTGPETLDLLESLGGPLQKSAGIKPGEIHFHVMLDTALNAMALPDQNIILNSGLILAAHDQNELAAVMAHEMGHIKAGHHLQIEASIKNIGARTMIALVTGIAVGAVTGNGQITQAAIAGNTAISQSSLLEVIREKERQADRLAIRYLNKAGFDPRGMTRFMKRLYREQRLNNTLPPYLLTHPLSSQRFMESQALIHSQQADKPPSQNKRLQEKNNALLARVQAALEASTSDNLNEVISKFRKRLKKEPGHFPARYGLAMAERYMGQLQAATSNLKQLLEKHPNDPYLLREQGMVHLEKGEPAAAEKHFRAALKYQPQKTNADLRYRLAFSLQEQNKLERANHILRPLTLEYPLIAQYFYLLGIVEGKQQHRGASHLALARHYLLTRDKETARWHYQEAIRQFSDTDAGKNIALNELKKMKKR